MSSGISGPRSATRARRQCRGTCAMLSVTLGWASTRSFLLLPACAMLSCTLRQASTCRPFLPARHTTRPGPPGTGLGPQQEVLQAPAGPEASARNGLDAGLTQGAGAGRCREQCRRLLGLGSQCLTSLLQGHRVRRAGIRVQGVGQQQLVWWPALWEADWVGVQSRRWVAGGESDAGKLASTLNPAWCLLSPASQCRTVLSAPTAMLAH